MSNPDRRIRLAAGVGAVAWAAALYALSASSGAGRLLDWLPAGSDKVLHAGAYALLAALLTVALRTPWGATGLSLAYGVSDEAHQRLVPGRTADPRDLLADLAGALLGALAVAYLRRRRRGGRIQ